ncbi:MAG: hypothetical protein J0L73_17005 [Verrucomicrobia bacterium]|nr:hypothetical protein [Verrucomicrobiota bacterium]
MKTTLLFSLLLASATLSQANPELVTIIDQEYGAATAEGVLLLQSTASAAEPVQWSVFARDPFRPGELVRASLTFVNGAWAPKATGAGPKLLGRVPPLPIAFNLIKLRSSDVLKIAQRNAMLAKTNFVTASYQLAADAATGAPQWGLALNGTDGNEVGFIVISAETGAVIHQQWNNGLASYGPEPVSPPASKGEKAADDVKRAARHAWEWTGDTGLEVGHFFKRLFKSGN